METVARFWALNSLFEFCTNPFCVTDFLCVMLDVLTYAGALKISGTKLIRAVRLLRLMRLFKVMRLLKKMRDELMKHKEVPPWKLPEEYMLAPGEVGPKVEKLKAMTAMTSVMKHTVNLEGQYKLQHILRALKTHVHSPLASSLPLDPAIFQQADLAEMPLKADLSGDELVTTAMHLVMYEYAPLVQGAINLLMILHMAKDALVNNLLNAQLLENGDDEALYMRIKKAVTDITHAVGRFDNESAVEQESFDALNSAFEIAIGEASQCDKAWELGSRWAKPVLKVQVMLRNLEFHTAFNTWRSSLEYPENGDDSVSAQRKREVYRMMNQLAVCFMQGNPTNQRLLFHMLSDCAHSSASLVDDAENGMVGASGVIFEMLLHNDELVKLLPSGFIESMLRIAYTRKSATVLHALMAVLTVGNAPNRKAQIEVMKFLTINEGLVHCGFPADSGDECQLKMAFSKLSAMSGKHAAAPAENTIELSKPKTLKPLQKAYKGPRPSLIAGTSSSISATKTPKQVQTPLAKSGAGKRRASTDDLNLRMGLPCAQDGVGSMDNDQEGPRENRAQAGTRARRQSIVGMGVEQGARSDSIQYMLTVLDVASACAAGKVNTAEAGIQSAINPSQMIEMVLDADLPLEIRYRVARLYFETVIEVQVPLENLEKKNSPVWDWIRTFPVALDDAIGLLHQWQPANGVELLDPANARTRLQYAFECVVPSITHFFLVYYTEKSAPEDFRGPGGLIHQLQEHLSALKIICHTHIPALEETMTEAITVTAKFSCKPRALDKMKIAKMNRMGTNLDIFKSVQSQLGVTIGGEIEEELGILQKGMKTHSVSVWAVMYEFEKSQNVTSNAESPKEKKADGRLASLGWGNAASVSSKLTELGQQQKVKEYAGSGMQSLLRYLDVLPKAAVYVNDPRAAQLGILRLEPLLNKLVRHTRGLIVREGDRKMLLQEHVPSTVWLLQLFRKMIEKAWGFGIDDRDDDGDDESDTKVAPIQDVLTAANAAEMCIDLVAKGLDREVVFESIRLMVALLFREGGNKTVQQKLHAHMQESPSDMFFLEIRDSLARIVSAHKVSAESGREGDNNEKMGEEMVLRVLQLSCEGHYHDNQEIIREQPKNEHTVNLLDDLAAHFNELCNLALGGTGGGAREGGALPSRRLLATTQEFADLILEVIQGPCKGNQVHFAQGTPLLETLNRAMRLGAGNGDGELQEAVDGLKTTILKIFKALLEAQLKPSLIYERVLSVLHLEVLQMQLDPPELDVEHSDASELEAMLEQQEIEAAKPLRPVQVESLVLMEMLAGYNEDLKDEMRVSEAVMTKLGSAVSSVEVMWNGSLQKRFFHIPEMCKHLSEATRKSFVYTVNRDNQDSKLTDFIDKTDEVFAELQHQQHLKEHGMAGVFSRTNQNAATWVAFALNLIINFIYFMNLTYKPLQGGDQWKENIPAEEGGQANTAVFAVSKVSYSHYGLGFHDTDSSPDTKIDALVFGFNVCQITVAAFTLLLFIVVRAPVAYNREYEETGSKFFAFIAVWTKSLTGYYCIYLVFALLGMIGLKYELQVGYPETSAITGEQTCENYDDPWNDYAYGSTLSNGACVFYKDIGPVFNSFLLYDIFVKSPTSLDVIYAVYKPAKQLMSTCILGVFTIYIFALLLFIMDADALPHMECNTLRGCFKVSFGMGLRNGGGMGDYLKGHAMGDRYWMDLAFFIIILIVLLNIIFGIIIDTFSELREEKKEKEADIQEKCFICNMDKARFDMQGSGVFIRHIKHEHNMWAYLNFVIFLETQDKDDDDGLEFYVRHCIEVGDIGWFPTNRSLFLNSVETSDEADPVVEGIAKLAKLIQRTAEEGRLRHAELKDDMGRMKGQIKEMAEVAAGSQNLNTPMVNSASKRRINAQRQQLRRASLVISTIAVDVIKSYLVHELEIVGSKGAVSFKGKASSFQVGDRVRVIKEGAQLGHEATVTDPGVAVAGHERTVKVRMANAEDPEAALAAGAASGAAGNISPSDN
jgi:hypothetical protein